MIPTEFNGYKLLHNQTHLNYHSRFFLLTFFFGKFLVSFIACAVDGSGDFYSPALVCGAFLGGAISEGLVLIMGSEFGILKTYIMFCMAGLFAAMTRRPLTAVLIVYDLTQFAHTSASLMFPMLMTSVVAHTFAEYYQHGDLYTLIMDQDGIDLVQLYRESVRKRAKAGGGPCRIPVLYIR